jgi:hypothetical protein
MRAAASGGCAMHRPGTRKKSGGRVRSAELAGDPPRFFFEDAGREGGRVVAVEKIFPNPSLEAAASFALRDMHEIVHEQFAVAPRFRANHDRMADSDATGVRGDDASALGGFSQVAGFRQWDPVDDQDPDPVTIPHTGPARISQLGWTKWNAVGKDEFFLGFSPLISERHELFECFLIDHVLGRAFGNHDKRARSVKGQGGESI